MRDRRSLLHFAILVVVAAAVAIFVLREGERAIVEIEGLHRTPAFLGARDRVADIAGWKLYRDEKYKFEVRYPDDFAYEKDPSTRYVAIGPRVGAAAKRPLIVEVLVRERPQTVEDLVQEVIGNPYLQPVQRRQTNLAGQNAEEISYTIGSGAFEERVKQIFLRHGENIISVSIPQSLSVFDTIASTISLFD